MEPGAAAAACDEAAAALTGAIRKAGGARAPAAAALPEVPDLALGLSAVAAWLGPEKAAAACEPVGLALAQTLATSTDPFLLITVPDALSALADRMGPAAVGTAATTLADSIKPTTERVPLYSVSRGLWHMAPRMETGKAVATLTRVMNATREETAQLMLAGGLWKVALRMKPSEAADAAAAIAQALNNSDDANTAAGLSMALSLVLGQMDEAEAAAVRARAVTKLNQFKGTPTNTFAQRQLSRALAMLTGQREREPEPPEEPEKTATDSARNAAWFIREMSERGENPSFWEGLHRELTAVDRPERARRAAALTAALGATAGAQGALPAFAALRPGLESPPCRLTTQQLVELLKLPTCTGEARRLVLDQLGNRYHRTYADVWEFVGFAQEQRLDLDFTTPPQRPEPAKASKP
jgi:hypothetical protein